MLKKIFKKTAPEDQREHYRRVPGKGAAMGVKVICANGAPISGTLVDLSAGGVAVEFREDLSEELAEGEQRELVFSSLTVSAIRAWGQVQTTPTERTPGRYGFQFLDAAALFEQLDDAYYKYFNRRQFRRAKPALGEKVRADLGVGNIHESVQLHDLSRGGASFYVSPDIVTYLELDMPVELTIHVPKTGHSLVHYALIRHMTPDARGMRIGVAMEVVTGWDTKRHIKKAQLAYWDYLQKRISDMDSYNSAYN